MDDKESVVVDELITLSKYNGSPVEENEFERIEILNGEIVAVHKIQDGNIVSTHQAKGVN